MPHARESFSPLDVGCEGNRDFCFRYISAYALSVLGQVRPSCCCSAPDFEPQPSLQPLMAIEVMQIMGQQSGTAAHIYRLAC
jgi:hypothetical protein